jgi:coenzyme F420-reducing hydrogenase gamma subunit
VGAKKPQLGVFKLASCDGCQLTLLNLEDELLTIAGALDIAHFPEASSAMNPEGPFDVTLVEGSVSTPEQLEELKAIRANSKFLVTIGACATAGGVQALRNFVDHVDHEEFIRAVYATPAYISSLATSTAISAHVVVDYELRGCPISKRDLLELISALLAGRRPDIADESVCMQCKRAGYVCVMVAKGEPCLGPVTHAGCGSLCPAFARGCYGCFGPKERANTDSLASQFLNTGSSSATVKRQFRLITNWADAFAVESRKHDD